jgi:hypothetical protein
MPLSRTLVFLCAATMACTNATAPSGGGSGGGPPIADPSFATDIQSVFDVTCNTSSCHGAQASVRNANLDLRRARSYGMLVNVMGDQEPIVRVIPGNANGSYLVIKLENRQRVGSRMPKGAPPLDATRLQNIKNWINQGAQDN